MDKEKIIQAIFDAIDEVNAFHPPEQELEKSVNTILFGESGRLDSLGLVNLIVAAEQRLEDLYGLSLTLADERAMSQRNSPFRTVAALADYISEILEGSRL